MKALHCSMISGRLFSFVLLLILCRTSAVAQTAGTNIIPIVTIQATQPFAGPGDPGVFTVFRDGNTNETLNVYYDIGGTASNGVDYAAISQWVNIPAGVNSSTITITPLGTAASNTDRTVILQLAPSPALNPVNFEIGVPSNALVYIAGPAATNIPPSVNIISPANGSIFYTPTNILLAAKATDPDDSIVNVEFFAGTNDLGPGSPVVLDPPGINGVTGLVYIFNWQNVPSGNYPLTAVATDNGGASAVSTVVNISVRQQTTNSPPGVRIISPANGAVFFAPVDIPMFANVNHPNATVGSVQFFDGTNSIGFGVPIPTPVAGTPAGSPPLTNPTNIYFLDWSNAPVGPHVLTAQAMIIFITHPLVLLADSDPVNITVLPPQPPPTNVPAIVDIVATDPVAIEGTNYWIWPGETNATPTWDAWPPAVCRFFTNSGPKAATFTVRRCGATNDALTVAYNTGGTASNGVDYVALPGSTTIPAGERRAFITVLPIDDGPPDINSTVILSLAPSTNVPPDYLIGRPSRAAAIIIDPPGPRAVSCLMPDKCFHLTMPGPNAAWFSIEYSAALTDWTPICTNQVINGSIDFIDPDAPANSGRFYRAVPVTNTPSQ